MFIKYVLTKWYPYVEDVTSIIKHVLVLVDRVRL